MHHQKSNQIFHYTRCNTPKRVTSWRGPSPPHCARATQLLSMSQRWRAVGNTVSDLTGPRFKPQTSRSRDERVTARPSGRCICIIYGINALPLSPREIETLSLFKKRLKACYFHLALENIITVRCQ